MNGWNPRLNSRGDIVSGFGTIWVNGAQQIDNTGRFVEGLEPAWLSDDVVFFKGVDDLPYSLDLHTKRVSKLTKPGRPENQKSTIYDGGHGVWEGDDRSKGIIHVAVDPSSGAIARTIEHNNNDHDHSITLNGQVIVEHRLVNLAKVRDGLVAWIDSGKYPIGYANGAAMNLTAFNGWHGVAIPVMTPTGPWVLVQTNEDLRLYPFTSRRGFIIRTGADQNFNPDIRFIGGQFHIVWNTATGVLHYKVLNPADAADDVSAPFPSTTPPVNPKPPKEPDKPVSYPRMTLPREVYDVAVALVARHRSLAEGNDDARRQLAKMIAETVRARFGEKWGWKSAHSNLSSPSKDGIARIPDGDTFAGLGERQFLYMFDLINGTTRQVHPYPIHSIEDGHEEQFFIPVQSVDHLASEPPQPPSGEEPPASIGDLEKAFQSLKNDIDHLKRLHADRAFEMADVQSRLQTLEEAVSALATLVANSIQDLANLQFDVSRDLFHSHTVKVKL